jgi:hypothetical protein
LVEELETFGMLEIRFSTDLTHLIKIDNIPTIQLDALACDRFG